MINHWIWGRARIGLLAAPWLLLSACASVDTSQDYAHYDRLLESATGLPSLTPTTGESPDLDSLTEYYDDGLTEEEAIRVALLNNPDLLASLASIGIARADLTRVGTLSNPSVSAALLFPSGGGRVGYDVSLVQSFVELWRLPLQRKVARSALERQVLDVADDARRVAADVRAAFAASLVATARADSIRANGSLTEALIRSARDRKELGSGTELEVSSARAEHLSNTLGERTAELESANARRRLARLLGLAALPAGVGLVAPEPTDRELRSVADLVASALIRRLDLRADFMAIEGLEAEVARQRRGRFGLVAFGGSIERSPKRRGDRTEIDGGPSVDLELPIFHQNQGGIAAAEFALVRARHDYDAALLDSELAIAQAHATYLASRDAEHLFRDEVLPEFERQLDLMRQAFELGSVGHWNVIEAQRSLARQRLAHLMTKQRASDALSELSAWSGLTANALFERTVLEPTDTRRRSGEPR